MLKVFLVDKNHKPLIPVSRSRARTLLESGRARELRRYPYVLMLNKEIDNTPDECHFRIKIDPGSKTTGMVVMNDKTGEVIWAAEIKHRGFQIKDALEKRRSLRRTRRHRKTRYRPPRFMNRTRSKGWLPPSLMSRVHNIDTWVARILSFCPIGAISYELVRFDAQKLMNPEISGCEYQQGELFGYEIREYLLEKFNRECVYCKIKGVPLEIEHIVPKSVGGSNRVSNLTISCRKCNQKKGNKTAKEFGHPKVQALAKAPLRDAAAVNATRHKLYDVLQKYGLEIETASGGVTKYNRIKRGLPKTHWLDAACVGLSTPEHVDVEGVNPLQIDAKGHGVRRICITDKFGFPKKFRQRQKSYFGFQTGDMVVAHLKKGKRQGVHKGRVTVRKRPSFLLMCKGYKLDGVHPKHMTCLHRQDGYSYQYLGAFHRPSVK